MRIAHIGPSSLPIGFQYGGAVERRMVELAAAQKSHGDDAVIFSASPSAESSAELAARETDGLVDIRCRTDRPIRDVELLTRSRGRLKSFRPEVIHIHNNWAGARALTGIGSPVVLSFDFYEYRGSVKPGIRSLYRWSLDGFDLLLPVSDYCGAGAARWWDLPASNFDVLPNGVNMEQFKPDEGARAAARRSLGFGDEDVVIGYVGRVCLQKGTDVLVRAFEELKHLHPKVALLVAGPTEQFGHDGPSVLTDEIERVGGRWIGPVPEDQLADIYRVLDVFVMPTRQYEMFGMAAAEALSSGTPVVCSRQGGLPEVVDESAGLLVPPSDAAALAAALKRLCESPELLSQLSAGARASVERFAWDRVAEHARGLYSKVLR